MGINGGRGINSGLVLGGSGISTGSGQPPFSFGNALKFDGVNDYVDFPNISLSGSYTLSFWFNTNAFGNFTLFGNQIADFAILPVTTTGIRFFLSGYARTFIVPTMSVGVWYHVLITFDGTNQRLYLNGSASSSNPTLSANANINKIGAYNNGTLFLYNGKIDEIAIWVGVTGTAQNAIDLYNGGAGQYADLVISNPTAYWRCNEADGSTTLVDETGNYNGTLNNFSTPPAYFIPH